MAKETTATTKMGKLDTHLSSLWVLAALFVAVFVTICIYVYAGKQSDLPDREFPNTTIKGDLIVENELQVRGHIKGAFYKISEVNDANNVIAASEDGTIFVINDGDHTATLPQATTELIGAKFKFIIGNVTVTNINLQSSGAQQNIYGVAVISAANAGPTSFNQATGENKRKINLDGSTQGGVIAGGAGIAFPLNVIEFTCVAAARPGVNTDCWFAEAQLMGSGLLASPFVN